MKTVWGIIERSVWGGFKVKIDDVDVLGFLPHRKVSPNIETSELFGSKVQFKIIEVEESSGRLILALGESRFNVSRKRKNTELESKALSQKLHLEEVLSGIVTNITEYGAFIKIGDSESVGLIHHSALGLCMLGRIEELLSIGDSVEVRVISLDKERGRIGLALKL